MRFSVRTHSPPSRAPDTAGNNNGQPMLRGSQWQRKQPEAPSRDGRQRQRSGPPTSFLPPRKRQRPRRLPARLRHSCVTAQRAAGVVAMTGVTPAKRRSDKSTDAWRDVEDRAARAALHSLGLVVDVGESGAGSLQLLHCCLPQSNEQSGLRRSSPRAKGREGGRGGED